MQVDPARRRLAPRPTLARHSAGGCLAAFAIPMLLAAAVLLLVAFGPREIRAELGHPPFWLLAAPGVLLAGIAAAMIGSSRRAIARARRLERGSRDSPGQRWTWDHPWSPRTGRSQSRRWMKTTLGTFAVLALGLTPFNYWAYVSSMGNLFVQIVVGVFDLLLLLAVVGLILGALQWLRYGDPLLHFGHFPFRLGSELNARLDRPRRLPAGAPLTCTLRCIEERFETRVERVREDREWKTRRTTSTVCYQQWAATQVLDGGGAERPYFELRFPLPADERLTTTLSENPPRYWELEVRGDAPGIDYQASFLVPVYA